MPHVLKILSVFITCSFAFKIGFPTAFVLFDSNFALTLGIACGGGIAGNIVFTFLSAALLRVIHNFRLRHNMIHRKKIFSSFNRRVIRVRQRFGLAGIAFITPILLSTPVGAFIAERFYKDKRKIILYLSAATVFWGLALYVILYFFKGGIRTWFL